MLLCLAVVVVSCSDDNETPAVEEPSYELDYKVTARQDAHAMATTLNDMLNLHFKQIVFEYTSLGPDMKTPVRLTGVISMNSAVYDKSAKPRGLMLYNEFTTAKHKERTSQNELDDIGLYMNKYQNMIAVSADLYRLDAHRGQATSLLLPGHNRSGDDGRMGRCHEDTERRRL